MIYLSGKVIDGIPSMLTPAIRRIPPAGLAWAADNGRYAAPADYSDERYLAWLARRAEHRDRCLFATAPDIVGNAGATLELSAPMLPRIRGLGYRAALVAQDGLLPGAVPWPLIDALFLGGTTAWKLSEAAFDLIAAARARGVWTHVGRVNTERRFRAFAAAGVDSADGTFLAFGLLANRARFDRWLAADAELGLWR